MHSQALTGTAGQLPAGGSEKWGQMALEREPGELFRSHICRGSMTFERGGLGIREDSSVGHSSSSIQPTALRVLLAKGLQGKWVMSIAPSFPL